jgi:phosphonate transport system permease protein
LNIIRSIEPLIWAIIFVIIVGLGPFAGIMALTVHSIAALGKLYSESIESIDPGPIEAIQATGANWLQVVVFAVVPQIVPPFVSFTIYRWDINIRMSTIIGFVGGGGIGFLLSQWIRLLEYRAAGIAVWFIAITVAILDFVSSEVRQRFV